ncbi:MAG: hypothetical protein C0616_12380 [Desulfuromonas sp.]|nr:MAG: hypothetical protein C0616_12380 [Desulfuromonas sp.]
MLRHLICCTFVVLVLLPCSTALGDQIAEVGPRLCGYEIGMPFEAAVALHGFDTVKPLAMKDDATGNFTARFHVSDDDRTVFRGFVQFVDNRAEKILLFFTTHQLKKIHAALSAAFGPPTIDTTEKNTPTGITLHGRFSSWQAMGHRVSLTYTEPFDIGRQDTQSGFVQLVSETYVDFLDNRRRLQADR